MSDSLIERDISAEEYREIVAADQFGGVTVHRIDAPQTMWFRPGGSTIRILDAAGIVHLVPGPGYRGAIHRWKPKNPSEPVQF